MKHRSAPSRAGIRGTAGVVLTVGLVATLAAGCFSEAVPPPGKAAAGSTASTDPSPGASPSGAGTSDPLSFAATGGSSCVTPQGRYIGYELVSASRPVTIDALDLPEAVGVQLGDSFLAPRTEGGVAHSGMMRGSEPDQKFQDDVNWAERRPLVGTLIETGEWYVFVVVDVQHTGRIPAVDLTWSDDLSTGISTWPQRLRIRERCA